MLHSAENSASNMLHGAENRMMGGAGYLRAHFQSRMVQTAFYSMILFYIVANPWLFEKVTGLVNAVLKEIPGISPISSKGQAIVVLHSIVFGLALYILTVYVFDPVMRMTHVIEGARSDRTPSDHAPSGGYEYKPQTPSGPCNPGDTAHFVHHGDKSEKWCTRNRK
jgi:hypothetical protein